MNKTNTISTKTLVTAAILTALVVVLQSMGAFIKFGPFSISLVLVPIVIGAATCGIWAGAWLGLVFGAVVLLSGDAAPFLAINPLATILVVLVKGGACGACASLVYNGLKRFNKYAAVVASAIVCPVVNTGIFIIGCRLFFSPDSLLTILTTFVGINFFIELAINIGLAPIILRLLNLKNV